MQVSQTTLNPITSVATNQVIDIFGSPQAILDEPYSVGQFSNQQAECDVRPTVSYDRANAKLKVEYLHAEFTNSTACLNTIGKSLVLLYSAVPHS